MTIYLQLLIVAVILVYGVDVSGFTYSWRSALARWLHTTEEALRPLPPFDCGKCATFWGCLIWAAIQGELSLLTAGEAAALSLLSLPIGTALVFIREGLCWLLNKITPQ